MSAMASHITGISIVCWTICSGVVQRKHQSSAGDRPSQRASDTENVSLWWGYVYLAHLYAVSSIFFFAFIHVVKIVLSE